MTTGVRPVTLGVIVGNRGFFPSHLAQSGRKTVLKVLQAEGIQAICLDESESQFGAVFSLQDSHKCSDLFRAHREEIDGILVTLPNFGEETAIANAIRWADLGVPVLVHAFPDDPAKMTSADRRDSFCGKMSCCSNLAQYGIRYSLTRLHTVDPESVEFRADLRNFAAMCRMVRGLQSVRLGAIGARPAAFKTVRFSEKLLERSGISVETVDLSEIFGRAHKLGENEASVQHKIDEIQAYVSTGRVPPLILTRMAKLGVAIEGWMQETEVVATALQCWTAMEEFYGVVPCTLMSMMSNNLMPSACETDVAGLVGMYAMVLATGKPSAIVDWNNNYGDDPDKAVIFHCSNLPKDIFATEGIAAEDIPTMDYQAIIAGTVGKENTYGTIVGRVRETPFTYCRVSPDDLRGSVRAYFGEGQLTNDPLRTFGGYGVVHIEHLQKLLTYICEQGFEHHVAINPARCASILQEGLGKYMGWDLYHHPGNGATG
jgi:L-fucose isomerase-like protein